MSLVADGPLIQVSGRVGVEASQGLRDAADDLIRPHDADVQVGQEAEHASALVGAAVEDDRAGLGDRDRTAGDRAVEAIELGVRERRVVADPLDARVRRATRPGCRPGRPGGSRHVPARTAAMAAGRPVGRRPADRRPVVADAFDEQLDDVVSRPAGRAS